MSRSTRQILTGVLIVAIVGAGLQFLPLREWLEPVWEMIDDAGSWGYLVFVLVGVILSFLMLPISPVMVVGGLLFGFWVGLAAGCVVLVVTSGAQFFVGRLCWPRFEKRPVFQNKWFKAVRKAIEDEGIYIVGMLRLTPFVHYTVGNVFYGSLSLPCVPFLVVSLLAMLPGTAILVFAGDLARRSWSVDVELPWWNLVLLAAAVVVGFAVAVIVTRKTLRILERDDSGDST